MTLPDAPESAVPSPPVHAITPVMVLALKQTRPWVLFLAILGFIGAGLCVAGGIVMAAFMGLAGSLAGARGGLPGGMGAAMGIGMGVLYLAIGVLYFFPSLYLLRYAGGIAAMMRTDPVGGMEAALRSQKSFWKFAGIAMISVLVLYFVVILVVFLVAGVAAVRSGPGV